MTKLLLALLTFSLTLSGCDGLPALSGKATKHRLTVIPSKPPKQRFEVTITDERYLTDVARRLGTTVEAIIADNRMADSTIKRGMHLVVLSTDRRFNEFERLQQVREERRIKSAEAKRLREATKAADLLKKKSRRRVRRKRPRKRRKRAHKRARKRAHKVHR